MPRHTRAKYIRLLELSPSERCPRGGWRFGTKRISDATVGRLVDSRRAEIRGDSVITLPPVNSEGGAMA